MIENLPSWISVFFVLTTLITVWFFYKASGQNRTALYVIAGWLLLQAIVGLSMFYTVTDIVPPRFPLLIGLPVVVIVTIAILSVATPFQRFAFDQPKAGVLYFPFVWLPCCVVPLVLLSHLATIRRLLKK